MTRSILRRNANLNPYPGKLWRPRENLLVIKNIQGRPENRSFFVFHSLPKTAASPPEQLCTEKHRENSAKRKNWLGLLGAHRRERTPTQICQRNAETRNAKDAYTELCEVIKTPTQTCAEDCSTDAIRPELLFSPSGIPGVSKMDEVRAKKDSLELFHFKTETLGFLHPEACMRKFEIIRSHCSMSDTEMNAGFCPAISRRSQTIRLRKTPDLVRQSDLGKRQTQSGNQAMSIE